MTIRVYLLLNISSQCLEACIRFVSTSCATTLLWVRLRCYEGKEQDGNYWDDAQTHNFDASKPILSPRSNGDDSSMHCWSSMLSLMTGDTLYPSLPIISHHAFTLSVEQVAFVALDLMPHHCMGMKTTMQADLTCSAALLGSCSYRAISWCSSRCCHPRCPG